MKNIQEQLKRGKNLRMNPDEKGLIRATLLRKISDKPFTSPAPSPYIKNILITMSKNIGSPFSFHAFAKVTALVLIVLIGGGASLSFASEKSLPGEKLYDFKISVKEPVREALAINKEERASIQAKRIAKRVEEVQALKDSGTLTEEKSALVKELIEEQSASFIETATELTNEGNSEAVVETTAILLETLTDYSEAVSVESEAILENEDDIKTSDEEAGTTTEPIESASTMSTSVEEELALRKISEEIVPEITGETLTDISAVIMSVTKSIETGLPEVLETIKEQAIEEEIIEAENDPLKTEKPSPLPITEKGNVLGMTCSSIDASITPEARLNVDMLIKENGISTEGLVLSSVSEKDGTVALLYTNTVSGITIYENTTTFIFTKNKLTQTIGSDPVTKKPFDETLLKVTKEEALNMASMTHVLNDCKKATLIAYPSKNIFGKTSYTPLWQIETNNIPVLINAETGEELKIASQENLR
jgi:hypothetical protein